MKPIIGYDLDGVLVQDFAQGSSMTIEELLFARMEFAPIFKPQGEWVLVTGRPVEDSFDTNRWVRKHFSNNMPTSIVIGMSFENSKDNHKVAYFKTEAIWELEIDIFYESNYDQYLKMEDIMFDSSGLNGVLCDVPVIRHWQTFLERNV